MRRQLANFSPIRGSQTVCDLSGRDSALTPRTNGVCEPRMRRRSKAPPARASLPSAIDLSSECPRPMPGNTAIPAPFVAPSDSAPPLTSAGRPSGGCSDASPKKVFETPAGIPADRAVFGSKARRIFHSSTHRIGITGKHTSDRLSAGCFPWRSGGIRAGGGCGPEYPSVPGPSHRMRKRKATASRYFVHCNMRMHDTSRPPPLPGAECPPPSAESGMCGVRKLSSERLDLRERSDKMGREGNRR